MKIKMADLESLIRKWAHLHNICLDSEQPIPQPVVERYQKARAYRIRQSYAKRKPTVATNSPPRDIFRFGPPSNPED